MKIIYRISLALALGFAIVGCDMNLEPYNTINPSESLETPEDAAKLENTFNQDIRSLAAGSVNNTGEIQSDLFHANADFGNRGGDVFRWEFTSSGLGPWGSCYGMIADGNFFLQMASKLKERLEAGTDKDLLANWDEDSLEELEGYIAEAYFLKAYCEYILVDKYCAVYSDATANVEDGGICLVDTYAPTPDKEKYPKRSTLKESFEHIFSCIDEAMKRAEYLHGSAAGSKYVTADAVKAFRARVSLAYGDYNQAIQDATSLINSGTYSLVSGKQALTDLFVNDNVPSECIMQSFVAISVEMPGSNDYSYMGWNVQNEYYAPDYIPEQWLVDIYDDNDTRKDVFFLKTPVYTTKGYTDSLYILKKFIGNPSLRSSEKNLNYANAPKPFRLAELYLIAAESYANTGRDSEASKLINELKAARISGYEETPLVGATLRQEIRDERVRELVGEGFRLSDLKRYGNGISRSAAQDASMINYPGTTRTEFLSKEASDYRFVWPIPTSETDANPKVKQNPGYVNN